MCTEGYDDETVNLISSKWRALGYIRHFEGNRTCGK
jgi:hypothetical protein